MRVEVYQMIKNKPELHHFLRLHPSWYRKLSRNPHAIYDMEREARLFYGRTFPQRMDRLQENVSLAMAMIEMMGQFGKEE